MINFLEFLEGEDTNGRSIFDATREELKVVYERLREQKDTIMKGKYKVVKKTNKLLNINPRAHYTPFGCHNQT